MLVTHERQPHTDVRRAYCMALAIATSKGGVEARYKLHEQNLSLFSTNKTYARAAEAIHTLHMLKCSMPSLWCPQCNLPHHI